MWSMTDFLKHIFYFSFFVLLACSQKQAETEPTVTTKKPVVAVPLTLSLAIKNQYTISATGGTAPYTFTMYRGFGSVTAAGVFTAAPVAGTAAVRITDADGLFSDATITVNPGVQISPTTKSLGVNATQKFTASGGVPAYQFALVSGVGSINTATGIYTAPATSGTASVKVTDSRGNISTATVNVIAALVLSPAVTTLAVNNTKNFVASGGVSPYTYSVVSGGGIINSSTGLYTAPAVSGSATVRVTDAAGTVMSSTITINPALAILPSSQTMSTNGTLNFSATGGVSPYAYSVISGGGSVNTTSGVFTAPAAAGSTVVRVVDSIGNYTDSNLTIILGLGISPAATTLAVTNSQTFTASGGTAPYAFSIVTPSGGSISSGATTGFYTAPNVTGTYIVRITDSVGATADASVTVTAALAITPATKTLVVNNTFTFSATGGVSPYAYSVVSGGGSVNASTGLYTAPAAAGSASVRVTDSLGNISNAAVTINAALSIASASNVTVISAVDTLAFSATGGISPYTFSVLAGPGSVNASTGLYAAVSAGAVTVRVTDTLGATSDFELTVDPQLTISPASAYVVTDSDLTITGVDGVPPYTYAVVSGLGSMDPTMGIYTAASTTGTATVRVTDSMNHTADSTLTIYNELTMAPLSVTMAVSTTQNFTASGGYGVLTYSVYAGDGSIDSSGVYTASASGGSVTVRVTDTIGNTVDAAVNVVSTLTITPQNLSLAVFSTAKFTSVLGTAPYSYSVSSGTGAVVAGTGVYTASSSAGSGSVDVTDAALNTSTANVTHIIPIEVASGAAHTCARYDTGAVKCWGLGSSGQLGSGSTANIGSTTAQVGGAIPFVDLGAGRTATALASGLNHTCAILDDASLKCWGSNVYGQLGQGNTTNYGSGAGQMGSNLPAINLGSGRTVTKVFAFGYMTCAILDNTATKCFGRNSYGQLGQDDIVNRGTAAGQMSDSLLAINLGSGRYAIKMVGGTDYACALLDNATLKCFGRANYGQTGYNSIASTGNTAGSMASLPVVDFGSGRTVLDAAATYSHTCVVLDNGTAKCFGRNQSGQLGYGNTTTYGDSINDMGSNLPAVPLTSFTPVKVWAGRQWSCAANASQAVRCWGLNSTGQLLVGNTSALGDGAGEVAALANINFGTGVTISNLSLGSYFGCAVMANKRIKCFGSAASSVLLNASTTSHLGDTAGELGDGLPYINH